MFTHLHVHTDYSLLDGVSRIKPMIAKAKSLGMDSLAITDHGNMHGAIEFYLTAREMGIKPILGCEIYVAPRSRYDKTSLDKTPYHLTVLAKDIEGYKNLCKLITKSHLEGFYYKPRVDKAILQEHSEGLVVLSGCLNAEIPKLITQNRLDEAKNVALWYKEIFNDYYLELQDHEGLPELKIVSDHLITLSKETDIPLVATNDFHYIEKEDAPIQDILICIHTNTNQNDEKRLKMEDDSYYLKSQEEMEALFKDYPEAIENTSKIANMCNVELEFGKMRLPEYKNIEGNNADDYLSNLCWDGLEKRFTTITEELKERLSYELSVIKTTQFANYFLVVWDIARFSKKQSIIFGVRGSAAASLVLYCLSVTDIDPIEYKLVFERFLNIERKEMPDIDMDFQDDRREEIIQYLVATYGPNNVAQIVTFGTLGAKAVIRDVGRALAMPYADPDRVAKLIPFRLNITLDDAINESPELREIYNEDKTLKSLIDTAKKLEGLTRHSSTHAAGIVISKEPLVEYVPLQRPAKGTEHGISMTQYPMGDIGKLGLLKLDILGLINLTILGRAIKLIKESKGIELDLNKIELNNKDTFDLLSKGETVNVFQLESAGMRRYIKDLKPSSIRDVAAMIALYRPGPMEHITTFIEAKHGRAPIKFPHDTLKEILEETYGVIVYQDQVLIIAQRFAGYSLGEADIVRKAMGKKIPEVMKQEQDKFIKGALDQGYTSELAQQVFKLIEPFAGYAFNKAHSMSYALISYWTAYFKANYPIEYMTAVLNSYSGNTDKIANAISECRRLRIMIMPPDINYGESEFTIEQNEELQNVIRFGMSAIKNVGEGAIKPILDERSKGGYFKNLEDLCTRADLSGLNKRVMESLIKVGAFDCLGNRSSLLNSVERFLSMANQATKLKESGQASMFNLFGESVPTPLGTIDLSEEETVLPREKLQWEKELLGIYLSENPISKALYEMNTEAIVSREKLTNDMERKQVILVGQVISANKRLTRNQRPFLIANLGLIDGNVEIAVWSKELVNKEHLWNEGNFLSVTGKVRLRNDQISINCEDASELGLPGLENPTDINIEAASKETETIESTKYSENGTDHLEEPFTNPKGLAKPLYEQIQTEPSEKRQCLVLKVNETNDPIKDELFLKEIITFLLDYKGKDSVKLRIGTNGHSVEMDMSIISVNCTEDLINSLEQIMGYPGAEIEELPVLKIQ